MTPDTQYTERKTSIIALLAAAAVYSIFVVCFNHYVRLTGDSTLYLSIAEKYVTGDFKNAINGYWGPLLSWLLVPFLYFGATHLFAVNALALVFGISTMTGVWFLSYRFEMGERIRSAVLISLVPVLLFVSLVQPMDFLLLCVLVYYLAIVFKSDYPDTVRNGLISGTLGAFAYFSKPYGLPFFISHFILMHVCHFLRSGPGPGRKKVLRNFVAGIVMFTLLSGVWISLISIKYDRLTFSNMGRGVFAALGPRSQHETLEKGDPIFYEGFFAPPNESAFVIYEDPSFARKQTWSPLESRSSFRHFIDNVSKNVFEFLSIYESFSRLAIAIIIAYVLLLLTRPIDKPVLRHEILYPLMTVTLYTAGYLPFHFETRYLWIVNILFLLMGGHLLTVLFKNEFFRSDIKKAFLTGFFVLSFIITPVKSYMYMSSYCMNKEMHDLGTVLDERYDIRGNIASNREVRHITTHDSWHRTFRLSYWLKSRYFGQARENISDDELQAELNKQGIDHYFFWGDPKDIPSFLFRYKEITGGEIPGLRIFSLKEERAG